MLLRIAGAEFRYQLLSPMMIVSFIILFLLPFFAMISDNVQIGAGGNVNVNAPFAISMTLMILSVFAVLMVPSFISNAILRDTDYKMDGILFATPMSKPDYLFGKYLGAFGAMLIAFTGVPLGMLIGTVWPFSNLDPETLGPQRLDHYLYAFFVLVTPTLLFVSAIVYAVSVASRSMALTYVTALGFFIVYLVGEEILDGPDWSHITNLADPFALSTLFDVTRYWTAVERNTQLVLLDGDMGLNRLIWLGVGLACLALAYRLFSFRKPARARKAAPAEAPASTEAVTVALPRITPILTAASYRLQLLSRVRLELRAVFRSLPFLILLAFGIFLAITGMIGQDIGYGLSPYPVTRLMVDAVEGGFGLSLMVVLIYYSADIIWRERTARTHEIIDAAPTPNWVIVTGKLVALAAVVASILVVGLITAVFIQLVQGYTALEIGLYLHRGFFHLMADFLLVAVLSVAVQSVVPNRFIGMMIMAVYVIGRVILFNLGFEHPLYSFARGVQTPLSDMNGSGRFIAGDYWLILYWSFFSTLLVLLVYLLWNRGAQQPVRARLRQLAGVKQPVFAGLAAIALVGWIGTGGFVYYNTNILNDYRTADDLEELQVAFEKGFRQYEDLPMPKTVDVKLDVDIYPYKRRIETRGTHVLQNKTDGPIGEVHLQFQRDFEHVSLALDGEAFDRPDERFPYFIAKLARPMAPGERRTLALETVIQDRGFAHARNNVSLVANGTFFNSGDITPHIGFSIAGVLQDRNTRRQYGLERLPRMPKLEDSDWYGIHYIRSDSDFVTYETTVSTAADQTAVAPGYLQREWAEGDRRYFHYKMDAPILNFYSYLSARYTRVRDKWQDVDIEVFHHAPHTYNVARMVESVKDSLAYFSEVFSPYQHRQLRILEFPAYRSFAQAFPNTVPYSESIGFIADLTGEDEIDLAYYVTAHEVAHQWWAHQVMAANVQGGTMLIESLAQYSALLVMEQEYGRDNVRKFLKYELDRYLSGRANDPEGELPLYRVENQQYIHYRKGSVIWYALRDYLGEETVNRTLRRLIELRAFTSDPYAISTDLIDMLRQEVGEDEEHQRLITDFLEKITLYDLKLAGAEKEQLDDGRWRVVIEVETAKFYADAEGNQTDAVLDIPVDIGVFTASPASDGFSRDDVLLLEKRRLDDGASTLEIIVDDEPSHVGIDPYNKLIDRNSDDNLGRVDRLTVASAG